MEAFADVVLGLDLQGGISVTQQPKQGSAYNANSLDLAVEKIVRRAASALQR